jgi:hypothetical protein
METRMVALDAATVPRREWAAILGITDASIKTYVERVLEKAGAAALKELSAPITRAAMTGDPSPAAGGRTGNQ